MHRHINTDDYPAIASMLRAGYLQKDIAETLGFTKSALSQEIKRNKNKDGTYKAHHARIKAKRRRSESKKVYRKIDTNPTLIKKIEERLNPLVSPEVIAHENRIHHQTIYSYLYRSRPDLLKQLPQRGRKRRRYGSKRSKKQGWTQKVKSIHDKPDTKIFWEGDTIKGGTRSRVLTHVEYTSLYTRADLIPDGTADSVHALLKEKPIEDTIVYDRGSEFALWNMIEKDLSIEIFFADPHHPWQRGKNENTNGRLRRVFPKKFDFDTITQSQLDQVIHLMNHTPRKTLNWRTPAEVYESLVSG
jgi:IS30 family transposase